MWKCRGVLRTLITHRQPNTLPFIWCQFSTGLICLLWSVFPRPVPSPPLSVQLSHLCIANHSWLLNSNGGAATTFPKWIQQDGKYRNRSHSKRKKKKKNDCFVKPVSIAYMCVLGLEVNLISYCESEWKFSTHCSRWQVWVPRLPPSRFCDMGFLGRVLWITAVGGEPRWDHPRPTQHVGVLGTLLFYNFMGEQAESKKGNRIG